MNHPHSDDIFDRATRDRHRQAVQNVSPMTLAKLRANRHAAMRGESRPVRGWPLGAAFGGVAAMVFAITFSLNFNPGPQLDAGAQPGLQTASDRLAADNLPIVTALDQDPDFYAWLASSDAQLMAME